jgi:hypothetical protein
MASRTITTCDYCKAVHDSALEGNEDGKKCRPQRAMSSYYMFGKSGQLCEPCFELALGRLAANATEAVNVFEKLRADLVASQQLTAEAVKLREDDRKNFHDLELKAINLRREDREQYDEAVSAVAMLVGWLGKKRRRANAQILKRICDRFDLDVGAP